MKVYNALLFSYILFCAFQSCSYIVDQEAIQEAEAEDGIVEIGQEVEVVLITVTRAVGKFL